MSSGLRVVYYCLVLLIAFAWGSGSRSVSPAAFAKDQKLGSTQGTKNSGQASITQQQLDLQKQQLQVQQEWQNIQQQQLDVQKEQLQLQKDQLARHLGFWDRFWQILPSVITALMAFVVALIALNFNHWSTRRTARQDHIRMLMDVDSRLIERPYLWTVYGEKPEPIAGKEDALNKLLSETKNYRELQENALMYAFFNMFEAVFDFHRHLGFFGWRRIPRAIVSKLMFWSDRRRADEQYKESWDRFAKDFFSDRADRRSWKLFDKHRALYSTYFQDWVEKVHEESTNPVAEVKPVSKAPSTGAADVKGTDNSTKPHS